MSNIYVKYVIIKPIKRGNYNRHLKTKKHKKKEKENDGIFKCSLCDYITMRRNEYLRHMRSTIHREDEDEEKQILKEKIKINEMTNKILILIDKYRN